MKSEPSHATRPRVGQETSARREPSVESLREEAVRHLTTNLTLPPELLPKPSDLTRREEALLSLQDEMQHTMNQICTQLTEEYLHPFLRGQGVPHPEGYRLTWGEQPPHP